jgi:hypothetical protein
MALGLFAISGSAASETAYSKDIRAESESTEAETENDAGWRSGSFYNTETLEVWLEYGPFYISCISTARFRRKRQKNLT